VAPRPAHIRPACALSRVLQAGPIALAIAQPHHLRPLRDQLADQLDQGDMQVFGTVPLGALADPPGQWQRPAFLAHMDHQGVAPAAHDAPVHDEHQRLQSSMMQPDGGIG